MKKEFHQENRASLCQSLAPGKPAASFQRTAPRKTGDEVILILRIEALYIIPELSSRTVYWQFLLTKKMYRKCCLCSRRMLTQSDGTESGFSPQEAQDVSGISDFRYLTDFSAFLDKQLVSGCRLHRLP